MALITCPECGKEISDKSNQCIHCGYPLELIKNQSISDPADPNGMNICPKCGTIGKYVKCPTCQVDMINCHCTESQWTDMLLKGDGSLERWEKEMARLYAINNEQFDKEAYNKQRQEQAEEDAYYNELIKNAPDVVNPSKIQCPYCKSTNTKKITTTSKAVHTALFGIFSMGRNSKQWHCDNCGSDF